MTSAENEIEIIESLSGTSSVDNQMALTLAICQCARQLARLADLYQFELGLDGAPDTTGPRAEAAAAPQFSSEFLAG